MPADATALSLRSDALRTPEARFANIPDSPWTPEYTAVDGYRMAHVDTGPVGAAPVLCLHGEPTWSFLYRTVMRALATANRRAIAPDLIGFGRSDKPTSRRTYTYAQHVAWMRAWIEAHDLRDITLLCQDWGSLIGLRVATAMPERFRAIVLSNGGLPTGEGRVPLAFRAWAAFARFSPVFPIGRIVATGCVRGLTPDVRAAYDAPFPDDRYKAGTRAFPPLVPVARDQAGAADNRAAWELLRKWNKPFLTAFTSGDPITRGGYRRFQAEVPGARGLAHVTLRGAGHFVQEDAGDALAQAVLSLGA